MHSSPQTATISTMKAIVIRRDVAEGRLELQTLPDPEPGQHDLQVSVRATAVNRADLFQRRGLYPAPAGVDPRVPGLEFAGEVVKVGAQVSEYRPGDRVMGLLAGGGYAESVVLHNSLAMPVPESFSFEEASAVPEVFLTAYDALDQLRVIAGETILIHAVASGVGTAALQLAQRLELRVAGTSRQGRKLPALEQMGLECAIDTSSKDFARAALDFTGGEGVNAIIDLVGGAYWNGNLQSLATRGRLILVGLVAGARVEADLRILLQKRLTVIGTVLRSGSLQEKAQLVADFTRQVLPDLAAGRLKPVVDRVLPLSKASEAHEVLENNETTGKIVLRIPS